MKEELKARSLREALPTIKAATPAPRYHKPKDYNLLGTNSRLEVEQGLAEAD